MEHRNTLDRLKLIFLSGNAHDGIRILNCWHIYTHQSLKAHWLSGTRRYNRLKMIMDKLPFYHLIKFALCLHRIGLAIIHFLSELLGHRMAEHPKFPLNAGHSISAL